MYITKSFLARKLVEFMAFIQNHYLEAKNSSRSKTKVGSVDTDLDIIIDAPSVTIHTMNSLLIAHIYHLVFCFNLEYMNLLVLLSLIIVHLHFTPLVQGQMYFIIFLTFLLHDSQGKRNQHSIRNRNYEKENAPEGAIIKIGEK